MSFTPGFNKNKNQGQIMRLQVVEINALFEKAAAQATPNTITDALILADISKKLSTKDIVTISSDKSLMNADKICEDAANNIAFTVSGSAKPNFR